MPDPPPGVFLRPALPGLTPPCQTNTTFFGQKQNNSGEKKIAHLGGGGAKLFPCSANPGSAIPVGRTVAPRRDVFLYVFSLSWFGHSDAIF